MVTTGHQAHRQAISAFSGRNELGGKIYSIQWQWLLWGCWKGGMIDFKIDFNAFSEKWTN